MTEKINQKDNQEEKDKKLKEFQQEISLIKERDLRNKGPAHLFEVDPAELEEEDMIMWQKIKDESITPEDLDDYRMSFLDEEGNLRDGVSRNRYDFYAFIANKAMVILVGRQLKKDKENS